MTQHLPLFTDFTCVGATCTSRFGVGRTLRLHIWPTISAMTINGQVTWQGTSLRHLSEISEVTRNMWNDDKIYNSRCTKFAKGLKRVVPILIKLTPVQNIETVWVETHLYIGTQMMVIFLLFLTLMPKFCEFAGHFRPFKLYGKQGRYLTPSKGRNCFYFIIKAKAWDLSWDFYLEFEICILVICLIITKLSQFNTSFPIQFHSKLFVESEPIRAIESWIWFRGSSRGYQLWMKIHGQNYRIDFHPFSGVKLITRNINDVVKIETSFQNPRWQLTAILIAESRLLSHRSNSVYHGSGFS